MDRSSRNLPKAILFVLSPTRFSFDLAKKIGISSWSWSFQGLAVGMLLVLPFLNVRSWNLVALFLALWVLPFSRIFEVAYAFFNDSLDRLGEQPPRTQIGKIERFKLLARGYVEVALQFAIIFFCLPSTWFAKELKTPLDAVYFSWMTITTTGY
jgi:hypothetical protein